MLAALCLVLVTEACAPVLKNFLSMVQVTALIRSVQAVLLVVLNGAWPSGPDTTIIRPDTWRQGLKTGVIWSIYFGIAAGVGGVVIYLSGTNPVGLFSFPFSQAHPLLLPLTAILIGPVCEEIFFRGFIYLFFRRFGVVWAIIITTLLFALMHVSGKMPLPWVQMVGGFVFCLAYERSKSLIAPIVIHVSGNFAILSLAFWARFL